MLRQYLGYIRDFYKDKTIIYLAFANTIDFIKKYDNQYFDLIIDRSVGVDAFCDYDFDVLLDTISIVNDDREWGSHERWDFVKNIKATEKLGSVIYNPNKKSNNPYLKYYTKLLKTNIGVFENERYRLFFNYIFNMDIPQRNTTIKPFINLQKKYILISPKASMDFRCYSEMNWVKIVDYLCEVSDDDMQIVFIGDYNARNIVKEIFANIKDKQKCLDITGKTDVSILPTLLSGAEFLIATETGTVHLAKAVNCKAICISNGAFYLRFHPYNTCVEYVYPRNFIENIKNIDIEKYYNNYTEYKTDDVLPEDVIKVINKIMNKNGKTLSP